MAPESFLHEVSYLFFNAILAVTFLACVVYVGYFISQRDEIRRWARPLLLCSWVLQTVYIVLRYVLIGNSPLTTYHEAVFFFAWATTAAYFSFRWRYKVMNFGTFVSLLIFCLLIVSAITSKEVIPLEPALRSRWLPVHAGFSLIAYGFLGLAFCGGLMYLLQERELKSRKLGYFFHRLPSLDDLDQLNSHCLAAGFIFLTLGMMTGMVWLKQVRGTYWQWHPKEVCSLVIWMVYLIQIHQRFTIGWRGRRAALMAIFGFAVVLVTLWIVIT